jgi:hypothetical protein
MAKEGTGSFVIPAHDKKRRIIHDDKSEFFNKDMRPTLFFMFWQLAVYGGEKPFFS